MKAHCTTKGTYRGLIRNDEDYQGVKDGTLDWKPHVREKMEDVIIPFDLFLRLMALDTPAVAEIVETEDSND